MALFFLRGRFVGALWAGLCVRGREPGPVRLYYRAGIGAIDQRMEDAIVRLAPLPYARGTLRLRSGETALTWDRTIPQVLTAERLEIVARAGRWGVGSLPTGPDNQILPGGGAVMSSTNWRKWATTTHRASRVDSGQLCLLVGVLDVIAGVEYVRTSPTYKLMAFLAPDYVWGGVLMVAGVALGWLSLTGRGYAKQIILLFLVAYFVFVTVIFAVANIGATAPITYFHVALTYAWLWWTERRRNG